MDFYFDFYEEILFIQIIALTGYGMTFIGISFICKLFYTELHKALKIM